MGEDTLIATNPARLQADYDREGLFLRIRHLRAEARAQGEPGLLLGMAIVAAGPITLALLGVALGLGAA